MRARDIAHRAGGDGRWRGLAHEFVGIQYVFAHVSYHTYRTVRYGAHDMSSSLMVQVGPLEMCWEKHLDLKMMMKRERELRYTL